MNDRFKFRVWDIEYKKYYPASNFCIEDLQDSGDEIIVEQCTGLRDKNGRLIYEGDIVLQTTRNRTCRIVFFRGAFCGEFCGWYNKAYISPIYQWLRSELDEVVGNIHETWKNEQH